MGRKAPSHIFEHLFATKRAGRDPGLGHAKKRKFGNEIASSRARANEPIHVTGDATGGKAISARLSALPAPDRGERIYFITNGIWRRTT